MNFSLTYSLPRENSSPRIAARGNTVPTSLDFYAATLAVGLVAKNRLLILTVNVCIADL
jgi:hypothetical protein